MTSIHLVEDDPVLSELITKNLRQEKYEVEVSKTFSQAEKKIADSKYDLHIVDLSLPDGSGFDLAILAQKNKKKFMIMTALNTAENRLSGYETGALEFVPKPFHIRELLLRVHHVLKEHRADDGTIALPAGSLSLTKRCFEDQTGAISFFSSRDFEVLKLLIDYAPQPVTRDVILNRVWGEQSFPTTRTVDNSILRLRQILRDEGDGVIRSIRGVGYQWIYKGE